MDYKERQNQAELIMPYRPRLELAELAARNYDTGPSFPNVPQPAREEEMEALQRLFEVFLLRLGRSAKRSPFLQPGALSYRWGNWAPPGKGQICGPYAVFSLNGEIWRLGMVTPQSIKILIMYPDADVTNNWDMWWWEAEERSLYDYIIEEALPTYLRNRKKRR